MPRWRQDRETGEFIEITNKRASARIHIQLDNVDFVSPVDGTRIRNRRELVDHEKRTGVSNDLDSLREHTIRQSEAPKETRESVHERKLAVKDAIDKVSSSGFHRRVQYDE